MSYALPIRSTPSNELPESSLELIRDLFSRLDERGINYCHWKSNASLEVALAGEGDLDLLIASTSRNTFQTVLFELGFKLVRQSAWAEHPAIYHYFGCDQSTSKIVHLHVYYRLITGGVLLKNFHLPLEKTLLARDVRFHGVRIASRAGELATMVVRKMVEAASPGELLLLIKDWDHVRSEIDWLLPPGKQDNEHIIAESYALLNQVLPTVDSQQYRVAVETLRGDTSWLQLHRSARQFMVAIRHYTLRPRLISAVIALYRGVRRVAHKIRSKKQPAKQLFTTGKVVAIVGPEASGKSTLTVDLARWLGHAVDTHLLHTGKPRPNFLTWLPNQVVLLFRKLWNRERFQRHEGDSGSGNSKLPTNTAMLWLYAIRSLWLAYDRKRTVTRAHRLASRGRVVICDRYPTATVGAMDSPRIDGSHPSIRGSRGLTWLAHREQHLYMTMPRAEVIVRLDVPLEVALKRNRERIKFDKEGDRFVQLRHAQWQQQSFACDDIITIDTGNSINEVIRTVRQEIWRRL